MSTDIHNNKEKNNSKFVQLLLAKIGQIELNKETQDGTWLLNAGLVVSEGATLYINSSDVSWLK